MDPMAIVQWAAAPVIGWVIYVERRLSALASMKDTVDKVDAKVDRLVDHLISKD